MRVLDLLTLLPLTLARSSPQKRGDSASTYKVPVSQTPGADGAVFTAPSEWTVGNPQLPNIYNKSAVDANAEASGYNLVSMSNTPTGLTGILKLISSNASDFYGYDYQYLNLTVSYQAKERLNVRIEPANLTDDVFILPDFVVPRPGQDIADIEDSDFSFVFEPLGFGFAIYRKSTQEEIFSTIGNPLVFENQFIQFNTSIAENHTLSGLGESFDTYRLKPGTVRTIKSNDNQDSIAHDIYGDYPVYYDHSYNSNATHAVWWRTSAIQEILVSEKSLTWRSLSGVIDLYFFSGPSPLDAIRQYVSTIGLPAFQQYFTLGYHNCKWGYTDIDDMRDVVSRFKEANIPLETQWSDIDYMDRYLDFTSDPKNYPAKEFKSFVDELHANNQHYVPIVDAGIYIPGNHTKFYPNYTAYHEGHELDVFLKNPDGSEYIGMVWPGFTVWPDWFSNNSQPYWTDQLSSWRKALPFDGLWTDMNEPSSFISHSKSNNVVNQITGPVDPSFGWGAPSLEYPHGFNITNRTETNSSITNDPLAVTVPRNSSNVTAAQAMNYKKHGKGNIEYPPYAINYWNTDNDLSAHHVGPNATHNNGFVEYDLNGVFGHMQTNATYHALLDSQPNKRPFIISRSTFTGSGNWTGHWGGDNFSDWPWAKLSIAQYFTVSSCGGIPFFGVDACGFNGNSDMELCSRWMQLASFFPFYRNHNTLGAIPQEPYRWEAVADATRRSTNLRYLLLPHYYTLLYEAHTTGTPVLRQFHWLFPDDKSVGNIEEQFFVGDSLVVTPVLEPNASTVKGMFPGAGKTEVYYDWYTHEKQNFTAGKNNTLKAPLGHIPLHVRGGAVLPTQEPAYTIAESRQNPFGLVVALDKQGKATGELYLDDGESVVVNSSLSVSFAVEKSQLLAVPVGNYTVKEPLANVTIMGVEQKPSQVLFNNRTKTDFTFENNTIFVTSLQNLTSSGAWTNKFAISWQ